MKNNSEMNPVDAVMTQIMAGCRAKVKADIKADLRKGKDAIKRVALLNQENKRLKQQINILKRDWDEKLKIKEIKIEKYFKQKEKELKKQKTQLIIAARKVNRGIIQMERLKKRTVKSLINNNYDWWYSNPKEAPAVRAIRTLARKGESAIKEI